MFIRTLEFITGRNEVVAKVIFLHLSVILFTAGVCLSACWDATPPAKETPRQGDPPCQGDLLPRRPPCQGDPPAKETPLCQGDPPWHTVNERPVRILLKCILVYNKVFQFKYIPFHTYKHYMHQNNSNDI